MTKNNDVYTHGHHESVLQSHKWRTVENSAQFLVKHLKEDTLLLDAGCGPGNITAGLSRLVPNGKVIGVDSSTKIIQEAQRDFGRDTYSNLSFQVGDIYELEFPDNTFDVVYAHQVLQHLHEPVSALKEFRRVLKPGGIIAVRDADYAAFTWYPQSPELTRWLELYHEVTDHNHAQSNGGRYLKAWAMQAGLEVSEIQCTAWVFSTEAERTWWANSWSKRATESDFAKQAIAYGLSTESELQQISEAFIEWSQDPQGMWCIPHIEVTAKKR